MRVEPYSVGSYLHIIKRGARGANIVRDTNDYLRFTKMLFLLNDKHFSNDWFFEKDTSNVFDRPKHWPEREKIVDIFAYTLMPNHFHLLVRERQEGGISLFMKRLGQSMTNYSNTKYKEKGSLFQGAYRSKTIEDDDYLRYVAVYIMVKNTFELYPYSGLTAAQRNFDKVWEWAIKYKFSSFGDYVQQKKSLILSDNTLMKEITNPHFFKRYAREVILGMGEKSKEEEEKLE